MSNSFGKIFRLTTFGESHGEALGGVIDGFPSGIFVDEEFIQQELDRRRPGQSSISTPRKETDKVHIFSGVFDGKSTGTPIGFVVYNENQHSNDYDALKDCFRPSHADYVYEQKYGRRDYRGGGRSSARETVSRVVAGAFAKLALKQIGIQISAYTSQIGTIAVERNYKELDLSCIEENVVRCPHSATADKMIQLIEQVRSEGDSIGGVVACVIKNVPVGLGEPVFDKLQSRLALAMLSINAAKGFDYGCGFECVGLKGSQVNDSFCILNHKISTKTNFSGGIQGGISNGQDIYFRVVFKPTATIFKSQQTVNRSGEEVVLQAKGRHDPCVVPRAVPIVEAMAAITMLDMFLLSKKDQIF